MFEIHYQGTDLIVRQPKDGKPVRLDSIEKAWQLANKMTLAAIFAGRYGAGFVPVPVQS